MSELNRKEVAKRKPYVRPTVAKERLPEVEPNVQQFLAILNEPLSKEEAKSIGMPANGAVAIGLYKIFRYFDKQ
jgi:hypothetical protein